MRRNSRRAIIEEDENEVPVFGHDSVEQSQFDNREQLQDVFQFIMATASTKGFVRETEVRKVFENASKQVRDETMEKVTEMFSTIFGLKLHHDQANSRYYIGTELRIPPIKMTAISQSEEEEGNETNKNLEDGLLISALMFIFMAKKQVLEDEPGVKLDVLKSFLKKVNDVPNDLFTAWFGPAKTANFIAHGWLNCNVSRSIAGEETITYDWGPRAEAVVNKQELLKSFCSIYNSQVADWPNHAVKAGY